MTFSILLLCNTQTLRAQTFVPPLAANQCSGVFWVWQGGINYFDGATINVCGNQDYSFAPQCVALWDFMGAELTNGGALSAISLNNYEYNVAASGLGMHTINAYYKLGTGTSSVQRTLKLNVTGDVNGASKFSLATNNLCPSPLTNITINREQPTNALYSYEIKLYEIVSGNPVQVWTSGYTYGDFSTYVLGSTQYSNFATGKTYRVQLYAKPNAQGVCDLDNSTSYKDFTIDNTPTVLSGTFTGSSIAGCVTGTSVAGATQLFNCTNSKMLFNPTVSYPLCAPPVKKGVRLELRKFIGNNCSNSVNPTDFDATYGSGAGLIYHYPSAPYNAQINLKTAFPTGFTNSGLYQLRLVLANGIAGNQVNYCIRVDNGINPSTIDVSMKDVNGAPQNIPTTAVACATPMNNVCQSTPTLDGSTTSGYIDAFWLKIEDCGVNGVNCSSPTLVVDGVNNPTATYQCSLGLSDPNLSVYVKNNKPYPTTNYFSDNPNHVWKITMYGKNICSTQSKTWYFKNNNPACRLLNITGTETDDTNTETAIVVPNPANDNTEIWYEAVENKQTVFQVFDMTGKVMINQKIGLIAGKNTLPITLNDYPVGVYFYKIGYLVGKIIKQ